MYNYYQPMNFRQQMPIQQMPTMPQQMMSQQEEILYVPNEQAAESYLMAPNSFVRLWDANQQVFYERRTDPQGRPFPMEKYEYRRITEKSEPKDMKGEFVTRQEFEALLARLEPQKGVEENV